MAQPRPSHFLLFSFLPLCSVCVKIIREVARWPAPHVIIRFPMSQTILSTPYDPSMAKPTLQMMLFLVKLMFIFASHPQP